MPDYLDEYLQHMAQYLQYVPDYLPVVGETDRRVGLWLQLHPELAAEPGSLGRQGPLGTSDLVAVVEESGSKELNSRLVTATQVTVSLAILGAAYRLGDLLVRLLHGTAGTRSYNDRVISRSGRAFRCRPTTI
jgi:hypothetical protein